LNTSKIIPVIKNCSGLGGQFHRITNIRMMVRFSQDFQM